MKKLFIGIFLCLYFVSYSQNLAQWRGPERNGIYQEKDLLKDWPEDGPELLWHYDELGAGHGSAAVIDSEVFITGTEGDQGFVMSFDLLGKVKWKAFYGAEWIESYDGVRTSPAIVGEKIYILSGYGQLSCLSKEEGQLLWQVDLMKDYDGINLKWGITENLLVYDDIVVCTPGGSDANVIGLDRHSGDLIWKSHGKGEISAYCSPALIEHNGRKIVVTHTEKSILGIDAFNGKLLWSHAQPNKWSVHANTPLYHEGMLYCVSGYGKGGVMLKLSDDGNTITEMWRDEELDNKLGGVILVDGRIYGSGDFNRKWICLDWKTGEELFYSKELKKGNIVFADGLQYWYSQSGKIALVEAKQDKFEVISSFKVPYGDAQHWAHLVIKDKRMFVRHGNSLMVYSLQAKKGISEWRGEGRTGIFKKEKGLLKEWPESGPELLWHLDSIPTGYASVSIANDKIYTTGKKGDMDLVIALDKTGEVLWTREYGRKWDSSYDESRCTPTVEGNNLYVSSGLGDLACLDATTGAIKWKLKAMEDFDGDAGKFGIAESILLVDDKVIFTPGGSRTTVIALDKANGELIWESDPIPDRTSYTSPLLINRKGEKIITTSTTNYFIGINADNGEMLWKFDIGVYAGGKRNIKNQTNTPLYHNDQIFITSGYDHKSIMFNIGDDNRSVSINWIDSLLDVHFGGVVQIDGYIYGANWINNRKGNWVCLDWESGKEMYSAEWHNKGSIISAENMLYCYEDRKGNIALVDVDPNEFSVRGSFEVPYGSGPHWAHPVIDNGILYIRHGDALMAYAIKE